MIYEKIKTIVFSQVGNVEIDENTKILDDLGCDSITLFQIINDIEDEFDIQIADAEEIITIGDAVKFVKDYKNVY